MRLAHLIIGALALSAGAAQADDRLFLAGAEYADAAYYAYTGVVLRFAPSASFSIDAENSYCDIHHSGLKVMEDIQKTGSTILKASRGSGGGMVYARMSYGELKIE